MKTDELGAEGWAHIPRPHRAQWGFLVLAAVSAIACIAVLATATRINPRASLADCCIDPKIPRTCEGFREDGNHVTGYLYENDHGRLKRAAQCPRP